MALTRVRIERILCPTDFSEFSERALRRAASLARWFEARVTALHVIQPIPWRLPADSATITVPADFLRELRDDVAKELERSVRPFRGEGISIDTSLLEGDPSREIQAAAEALPADLVVMGTHGRSGFEHLLLGSVTEKVLRRAPCPVLIVGSTPAPPSEGPLSRRIVCATDLTEASKATLDMALSLAAESLARVTLLHVLDAVLADGGLGEYRPVLNTAALRNELAAQARWRLSEAARPASGFCDVIERVETGKAWQEILRVAEETDADLVVMGAHSHGGLGRLFLGSTANQVVRRAPCPVLIVRHG